jgi:hypothetical protein
MLHFPPSLMREAAQDRPRLVGVARSGGRSASGIFTMSRSDGGGLWSVGFRSIALRTADHVRAYEAVTTAMAEGSRPIVVPICDRRHFPAPTFEGNLLYSWSSVPHSDDSLFSDGTGYSQSVVVIATSGTTALRATQINLGIDFAGVLHGGELFSIDHTVLGWRMYRIIEIVSQTATAATVKIEPPLREAVANNTPVEFDLPRCIMQLASPADLTLEMRRFGNPSISFVESFLPLD